jgi:predicted DNA-binding transcriptional regulator AlpA
MPDLEAVVNLDELVERLAERISSRLRTDEERLLSRAELADRLSVSQRAIGSMLARGELPQPLIRTSGNGMVRWLWTDVLHHLKGRQGRYRPRRGRGIRLGGGAA